MKAVRIHKFGGPDVLQLDDIAKPEPKDGKRLIRVAAASVNPVDYKIRRGGYPKVPESALPVTLGRDVAGTIEGSGAGFDAGEEVYAHLDWDDGGYAEYALCAPSGIAKKPASLNLVEAAAVPLAATTAWQGLFDHGKLEAGQTVLIHGGSGAVGGFAVQFAKIAGAKVIATASGEGVDLVRRFGADVAVDYKTQRFEDFAHDVDLVLDLVGNETQDRSFAVVKRGGRLMSAVQAIDEAKLKARNLTGERYMATPNADQLKHFAKLIDEKRVVVTLSKTFPLAEASAAHRCIEEEHPRGKVVLTVT
jgi:NADPH:quinone reductase-like Zn-dependent oxidoreductase